MANVIFLVNVAFSAVTWLVFWARPKLRPRVAFHAVALGAGAVIYVLMIAFSWGELAESGIPFRFGARVLFGAVAWLPFVIFVVAAWVRELGAAAAALIRDGNLDALARHMRTGAEASTWTLDSFILKLHERGLVDDETAKRHLEDPSALEA